MVECTICCSELTFKECPSYFTGCKNRTCETAFIYCEGCLHSAVEERKLETCPTCRSAIKITRGKISMMKRRLSEKEFLSRKARSLNSDNIQLEERMASIARPGEIGAEYINLRHHQSIEQNPDDAELARKLQEEENSKAEHLPKRNTEDSDFRLAQLLQMEEEKDLQFKQDQMERDSKLALALSMEDEPGIQRNAAIDSGSSPVRSQKRSQAGDDGELGATSICENHSSSALKRCKNTP